MNNLINAENLRNKLKEYKIEDERNKYIFKASLRYIISSSIFFIILAFIAGYSLYKGITGIEKLTLIKIVFIVILFGYIFIAAFFLFTFKIVIENNEICLKNLCIKIEDIENATLKIIKIGTVKADNFLEIITKDKTRIQIRLNINNQILFLKLIQNQIGEKLNI